MAGKKKTFFICSQCGNQESKWMGRCPQCGEWNSLIETEIGAGEAKSGNRQDRKQLEILNIADIEAAMAVRTSSGVSELDRVLGGGVIPGSSVLVGGEPGIGKSTLLMQAAAGFEGKAVLYVSGEESAGQIKMRAERLGLSRKGLWIFCETELDKVLRAAEQKKAGLLVIDSIQTIFSAEIGTVAGTVNQIKYCSTELADWAKMRGSSVFFIAHVTKEGSIAGPKLMEHMVDTVLYFEQSGGEIRFLRSSKNRFGSSSEIGLFGMRETGLVPLTDPSSLFLVNRSGSANGRLPPGVAVTPVYEGSRAILVEIQALTVAAKGGMSRSYSDRIDNRRVSRIAAVLEKHLGLRFSDQDIYINVAGGMRITEVGVELALALALYSARTGLSLPRHTAVTGEVSLAGEIRPVSHLKRRIRTAAEMGFSQCVAPAGYRGEEEPEEEWTRVSDISECIKKVFGKQEKGSA